MLVPYQFKLGKSDKLKLGKKIQKYYVPQETAAINEKTFSVEVPVSDESLDRHGDVLLLSSWKKYLPVFKKHPILIVSHIYVDLTKTIGRVMDIRVGESSLNAKLRYFVGKGNRDADWAWLLVTENLAAYSVGFKPHKILMNAEEIEQDQDIPAHVKKLKPKRVAKESELLEISQVSVPANANAIQSALHHEEVVVREIADNILTKGLLDKFAEKKFYSFPHGEDKQRQSTEEETKSVVSAVNYPNLPENRSWDANAAVIRLRSWAGGPDKEDVDFGKYKKGFAWFDDEDSENFTAYKLPHHDIVEGEIKNHWRGTAAAMASLLGARGGVDLPEGDRQGVWEHLATHYRAYDREPPEFKTYETTEDVVAGCKDIETAVLLTQEVYSAKIQDLEQKIEKMQSIQEQKTAEQTKQLADNIRAYISAAWKTDKSAEIVERLKKEIEKRREVLTKSSDVV